MTTRRPLTITAVAAGIGTVFALALGPIASAATVQAGHREASRPAAGTGHGGSRLALADTGAADTTPYAVGGAGFLVAGVGLVLVGRRLAG
ncbi:LPXTG-motif cell wall-anchored protein [Streptacidiphilus sp. EB129]